MPSIGSVLESQIARLNAQAFWKEFTFSRTTFSPRPGQELELADNLVWLGDFAFALQLKQRDGATSDPQRERAWFKKKVLTTATRQVRDTLRFLSEQDALSFSNERGHRFSVSGSQLSDLTKIIVFLGSPALPADCRQTRHHISETAGFIHIVSAEDYLRILETLRVPRDIRDYFGFREGILSQVDSREITEADIVGAFIAGEPLPTSSSHERLGIFSQDLKDFDISWLIANLFDHIEKGDGSMSYYEIMLEFARVPRSVWREVKRRLVLAIGAAQNNAYFQPSLFAFPGTDCTFMIAAVPPGVPDVGADGEAIITGSLKRLADAAMYYAKTSRAVGIMVTKEGEHFQVAWCHLTIPWVRDPKMDALLQKSNPFRRIEERILPSFLFNESW